MQDNLNSPQEQKNLLTIGEAANYLGISIDTIRRWDKKGKLSPLRSPGGHRYFKTSDLDKVFGKKYERSEETKPRAKRGSEEQQTSLNTPNTLNLSEDSFPPPLSTNYPPATLSVAMRDGNLPPTSTPFSEIFSEVTPIFQPTPKVINIPKVEPVRIISEVR